MSHYKYWLDEIWNITVNPKPKPKTLECEIEIWEECKFYIRSSNNYYSESRWWVIEIDARRWWIELEWLKSWEAIVYVKSYTWNYITHILKIKVKPKPPRIYTCETPIWRYCESHKQKIYDWYTFSTTNPKLISLERERIWNRDWRTDYV